MKKNQIKHCYDKDRKTDSYAYLAGVKEGAFIYFCNYCNTQFEIPVTIPKTK
jgi:hypothetical protein